ncbi:phenylacetate--CoA ligase family protein [Mycolicibacterium psychrotolerans]|uniref:Phenylacetate-coenzyme A ligase n=1 Tax=Mycolicibacterium psychrotolerans TaxID=216929 RepID=A0A7I7MD77_9MYCO|nr:phenylacetate--CoA ligase family protein [Mycolicibacterium psychrotolerans]BBX69782.1 phenylacetate-coenzyme A ligase [Mycolicibacterium psychrotolerans]
MSERLDLLNMAWEAWRFRRGDGPAIADRQQIRLDELVHHARTASPYYRHLYRNVPSGPVDVRSLPVTAKRELMGHFDDWVTDPDITIETLRRDFLADPALAGAPYLGRYHVVTTSGTTGDPAVIVHDARSWALLSLVGRRGEWHTVTTRHVLGGMARRGLRVAALFVGGGHFGAAAALESARRRNPSFAKRFRVFSVLRPIAALVAELNDFQPTVLEGYPSALTLLAAEQRAGRLCIRPVLAITAGEELTAPAGADIESTFDDCVVQNRYGSAEFVALGAQCSAGLFHINSDWFLFEPVDEHYRPVAPGAISHTVLVTNLANRVQPLIRYDLGDRVEPATSPCPCGNGLPGITVQGRAGDLLTFASPEGESVWVLPLALGTVVEETAGVRRFQVIRTQPQTVTVRLECEPDADPVGVRRAVDARLREFFRSQGVAPVDVRHAAEPPSVDAKSGKFRQVWSATSE